MNAVKLPSKESILHEFFSNLNFECRSSQQTLGLNDESRINIEHCVSQADACREEKAVRRAKRQDYYTQQYFKLSYRQKVG